MTIKTHFAGDVTEFMVDDSYKLNLIDKGTKLEIAGQAFDIYGTPRTITVAKDGSIRSILDR